MSIYVSGFEKRGDLNSLCKVPSLALFKLSPFQSKRASDFILGLWAHQAFCFTNPIFEAVASHLSEVVAVKPELIFDHG